MLLFSSLLGLNKLLYFLSNFWEKVHLKCNCVACFLTELSLTNKIKYHKAAKPSPTKRLSLQTWGSRTFSPDFFRSLENPPHITTIVRATLLSQSKDQNSSHVFKEQMSYQLGWCEHRYNADRKPRQSLVEPIMGRAVGADLQTLLFLCRATLRYMINFLTKSIQAAQSLPSL